MDIHSRPILVYRWVTFLLAAGYTLYQIFSSSYEQPFGPFRFLTIWALLASFYAASRMLALSERRIDRKHEVTAMCASVLNVMVLFLYWNLYFKDPSLVNGNGPIKWWLEYYLHGLGPLLQIFDAVFIARVFQRPHRAALPVVGLVALYVCFSEFAVAPLATEPTGRVTSGLPYPYLNNMELMDRWLHYASNGVSAVIVLVGLAGTGWAVRRWL